MLDARGPDQGFGDQAVDLAPSWASLTCVRDCGTESNCREQWGHVIRLTRPSQSTTYRGWVDQSRRGRSAGLDERWRQTRSFWQRQQSGPLVWVLPYPFCGRTGYIPPGSVSRPETARRMAVPKAGPVWCAIYRASAALYGTRVAGDSAHKWTKWPARWIRPQWDSVCIAEWKTESVRQDRQWW